MAAFNWVNVQEHCPACGAGARFRCQVHVASDYAGDRGERYHDRDYELGETMRWWPREDSRFRLWRAGRREFDVDEPDFDEEACYAACDRCTASVYVVLRFRENVPERVVAVGIEEEWPAGFMR
jgi:hypothetical protein